MSELKGRILTPEGWIDGSVGFTDRIASVTPGRVGKDAPVILPGFIDLHTPGGGGADALGGEDSVRTIARTHARFGTTSFLPSPVTAPGEDLEKAVAAIGLVAAKRGADEARVLGAHVEGPFLNPERLGAQPPFTRAPDAGLAARLLAGGEERIITHAPALPGRLERMRDLSKRGVRVLLGHTAAS